MSALTRIKLGEAQTALRAAAAALEGAIAHLGPVRSNSLARDQLGDALAHLQAAQYWTDLGAAEVTQV